MNEFYDSTGYPQTGAGGSSASMRAELDSIEAGFNKLPTLTGNSNKLVKVNSSGTALQESSVISDDGTNATVAGDLTIAGGNVGVDADSMHAIPNVAADTLTLNSASQTLTNKTIVAANNTITTAASGNLAATNLNAALAELQTDVDTRSLKGANSDITSLTGLTTPLSVAQGGTGSSDSATARTNLGLGTLATQSGTFSGTSSGTNTGDQSLFSTIAVSGQSSVVADAASDTLTLVAGTNVSITTNAATDTITINATAEVADGDKGDITVSGTGTAWTIDNGVVTSAKMDSAATPVGLQTIYIPAGAMIPRTTNGAASGTLETTTNKLMVRTLDFDTATAEYAQFNVRMPKSWDEGTVTAYFVWSHPATTTNFGVVWGLQGVAISDDDALDVAFGTVQVIADTGGTTNDLYQSAITPAITIGGTPQELDWVVFQINRDVAAGGDTLAVDARLHGVVLMYSTNRGNDA